MGRETMLFRSTKPSPSMGEGVAAVLVLVLLLTLSGCGGLPGEAPSPAPPSATEVTKSVEQNGRFVSLVGPRGTHGAPFLGVPSTNFFTLRTLIDTRTGETAHQLYVEDSYFGAKRNWQSAHDRAGAELRFVPISVNEISCNPGCSYAEEFAATLPDALLRANPRGIEVTFDANSGDRKTIAVPGALIQKQLAAVDAARATLPQAAATPAPAPALR